MTKRIAILYFDAASGHRSAATALKRVLDGRYHHWQVQLVNIVDVFDHHKRLGSLVRYGIDRFNRQIKNDRIFDLGGQINLSLLCHDLLSAKGIAKMAAFWAAAPPDLIVSVTPMYNPALYRSVRLVNPEAVCVTIPVDFDEVKARYWFTPKVEQHYLNGTARLAEQAKTAGVPASHNHRISGMIVDPDCYQPPTTDRTSALRSLGLDPDLPTGLISFGGQGCTHIETIAGAVAKVSLRVNMIFLCGRNETVYEAVNRLETPYPKRVFSYLPETPFQYLHLADFAIGKPGAMTITEALITQTPLIALKSKGMRPVQRGNEAWLVEHEVGILADGVEEVVPAIRQILSSAIYRQRAAAQAHRAIDEAAGVLGSLVQEPEERSMIKTRR